MAMKVLNKSCWIRIAMEAMHNFKVPIIIRNSAVSKIILCIFWPCRRNKMLLTRVLVKVKGITILPLEMILRCEKI